MDIVIFLIAQNDPRLAAAAEAQIHISRPGLNGMAQIIRVPQNESIASVCRIIRDFFMIGSSNRLAKLHIVAHGRVAEAHRTYIEIGEENIRVAQTRHFRDIRYCWINTGTVAPGACIELNVCSAAGYALRPITVGLAQDSGMVVKACPVPIQFAPQQNLYNPSEGFRSIYPGVDNAISQNDYIDVEDYIHRRMRR